MSSPEIERFEERGFFLTLPFPDEDSPTVLYVADKDFETLKDLAENTETSWRDLRDELQELLDHSGHEENHTFSRAFIKEISDLLADQKRPEKTSIEDPLEDLGKNLR